MKIILQPGQNDLHGKNFFIEVNKNPLKRMKADINKMFLKSTSLPELSSTERVQKHNLKKFFETKFL